MSEHRFRKKAQGVKTTIKITRALFADRDKKGPKLSCEDANYILANTDLDEKDLRKKFREFIKDCPNGLLDLEKVIRMLKNILPEASVKILAEQIFTIYDKDKKGSINFTNFIMATHCLASSSVENKLHLVFQLCDTDRSSVIQLKEMVGLFGTFYINEGIDKHLAVERAYQIFNALDVTHDGYVTEDDFVQVCMKDRDLIKSLT